MVGPNGVVFFKGCCCKFFRGTCWGNGTSMVVAL